MKLLYLYSKFIKQLRGKSISNCKLDPTSHIYAGCEMYDCTIGRYSYVSYNSKLINTKVGAFCSIADHVYIGGNEHPIEWVSTSPVFQNIKNSGSSTRFARHEITRPLCTDIGNDVWIGHAAIIKAGVKIGNGAIIGAGAVVTKDIPPYAIAIGVPAKIIRYRFNDDIIKELQETEWWNFSNKDLKELGSFITSPTLFIAKAKDIICRYKNELKAEYS